METHSSVNQRMEANLKIIEEFSKHNPKEARVNHAALAAIREISQALSQNQINDVKLLGRIKQVLQPYSTSDQSILSIADSVLHCCRTSPEITTIGQLYANVAQHHDALQSASIQESIAKDKENCTEFLKGINNSLAGEEAKLKEKFSEEEVEVQLKNYIIEQLLQNRRENPREALTLKEEIALLQELQPDHRYKDLINGLTINSFSIRTGKLQSDPKNITDLLPEEANQRNLSLHNAANQPLGKVTDKQEIDATLENKFNELHQDRIYRLKNLLPIYRELFPEGKPRDQEAVGTKFFPKTAGWVMGTFERRDDLIRQMETIAQANGMFLITDASESESAFLLEYQHSAVGFMETKSSDVTTPFFQDFFEFTSKELRIPCMPREYSISEFSDESEIFNRAITADRAQRSQLWDICYKIQSSREFKDLQSIQGVPFTGSYGDKAIFLSEAIEAASSMNLTYSEGGNTLIGCDDKGPYMIMGKDSFAATKQLMEAGLKRKVTNEEVYMAFAIDYGIPMDRIHFIEQPGDFHLDMSMAIIGERTILLNDSMEAYRDFEKNGHLTGSEEDRGRLKAMSQFRKRFEDIAADQLEKQGFKVVRYPGRFNHSLSEPAMNFFNMVTATTPSDEKLLVTMAPIDKTYEESFRDVIAKHGSEKNAHIHFVESLADSKACLGDNGGLACRGKGVPY